MDPISVFDQLLESQLERWQASCTTLLERLRSRGCAYDGKEMVRVLRPKFLGSGQYAYLDYACGVLMGALRRLADRALEDEGMLEFLGVTEDERMLASIEPLCPDPCAIARLDTFLTADGVKFVELNGEAPAGPGFCEVTNEVFQEHPLIRMLTERTGAQPISTMEGLVRGLLMAWRAAGKRGRPRILVTDYLDVPTASEFYIIADYVRRYDLEVLVEDARNLDFHDGQLFAQGMAVDLVYRRLLTNELLQRRSEVSALIEAYRAGAVVVVDPFRAKLAHKKSAFAVLTGDHVGQDWLTREERTVIDRHVPWTRVVGERKVTRMGEEIDLLPFVLENREIFVLKPSDDYGGRGVVIGWETGEAEFQAALEEAARDGHVVQERVNVIEERFPVIESGLEQQSMIVDMDPYVYMGRVHGALARLSAGALCNVTSGGGQVPVFLHPDP